VIEQLKNRGFGYGTGSLSPDCSRFIVNVPKNASSYMLDWAGRHKWSMAQVGDNCDWHKVTEMIVVLRDPLERWISGIAQYLHSYILFVQGPNGPIFPGEPSTQFDKGFDANQFVNDYNPVVERLIFDQINRFDDHVWPQHEFFNNLLPDVPRKYFWLDRDFDHNISSYLGFARLNNLDKNVSNDNTNMHILQQFFKQRFVTRPELAERVKKSYAKDYQLIEQVFNQ
jgi:hypothetical protein